MFDLVELLKIENKTDEMKIHFATGSSDELEALKEFETGSFKKWQESQTRNNFSKKYVFSIILFKTNVWLFAGIYEILDKTKNDDGGYLYKTKLTNIANNFIGRLLIYHRKNFRNSYPHLDTVLREFTFHAILEENHGVQYFPGARNVIIDYKALRSIYNSQNIEWKIGLSQLKAVYLIADTKTGKKYVGSATGKESVWSRWQEYITTGHGGNEKLKKLIESEGDDYKYNYLFSILEVFGDEVNNVEIVRIENRWMDKLLTRGEFGYNLGKNA